MIFNNFKYNYQVVSVISIKVIDYIKIIYSVARSLRVSRKEKKRRNKKEKRRKGEERKKKKKKYCETFEVWKRAL